MIKFGTDGWRALMDDSFNTENVKKVAQAVANYLKDEGLTKRGIIVGYDTRKNSKKFAKNCADILTANSIKTYLPRRATPTPITAFTIRAKGLEGAIMITASHNPPEYNGIKFIPYYAGPATEDITKKIEAGLNLAKKKPFNEMQANSDLLSEIEPLKDYEEHIEELIDVSLLREKRLKVLANPMYGAAYGIFVKMLKNYGFKVEAKNNKADANFGGITPEPILRNMPGITQMVKDGSFSIALSLDGDADRFGAVDGTGKFIQANHALALIAEYLVTIKGLNGALVRSVATTHFLDLIASKSSLESIETPVGFKHIGKIMREKPVVLGGEESAGLSILNHIPEKDGILACLILAEISAYFNKPLSAILEDLFAKYKKRYISKRLDLKISSNKKKLLIEKLKNNPPKNIIDIRVSKTIDIDGVKFILEEGSWLLARPSGTESIVRIYLETDELGKLEKLEAYAKQLLS